MGSPPRRPPPDRPALVPGRALARPGAPGPQTVRVETVAAASPGTVALYARVSSHDQRADLDRQLGRLAAWATAQDWPVTRTVAEVGSGMSDARPKLRRLLAAATVTTIVVEHRDRLARLGPNTSRPRCSAPASA